MANETVIYDIGNGKEKISLKDLAKFYSISYKDLKKYYLQLDDIDIAIDHAILRENQKKRLAKYLQLLYVGKNYDYDKLNKIVNSILDDSKDRESIVQELNYYNNLEKSINKKRYEITTQKFYDNTITLSSDDIKSLLLNTDVELMNSLETHEYSKEEMQLFKFLIAIANKKYNVDLKEIVKSFEIIGIDKLETLKIIYKTIETGKLTLTIEQYEKLMCVIDRGIPSLDYNKELYNDLTNYSYKKINNKYSLINESVDDYKYDNIDDNKKVNVSVKEKEKTLTKSRNR